MLKKFVLTAVVCCSVSAVALPNVAGTYICGDETVKIPLTIAVQEVEGVKVLAFSGELATELAIQYLPCGNAAIPHNKNGVTGTRIYTCDNKVIGELRSVKNPAEKIDASRSIAVVRTDDLNIKVITDVTGTIKGKKYPSDPIIVRCAKK